MSEHAASPARGRHRPVERFLGPQEAAGGPFALLGISPDRCNEGSVLLALERQLDRVNAHAQCDTPEADEVRLALHAAAAQLLDPFVRRHLIARWSKIEASRAAEQGTARPSEPRLVLPPPEVDPLRLLAHDAILTLGVLGWNQVSLRRLASLAHARGLSNEQLATALRGLVRAGRPSRGAKAVATRGVFDSPRATPTPHAGGSANGPALQAQVSVAASAAPSGKVGHSRTLEPEPTFTTAPDPGQELLKRALLIGGGGLGLLVALGFLIIAMTQPRKPAAAPPAPGPAVLTGRTGATGVSSSSGTTGSTAPNDEPVTIPVVTPKPRRPSPPPNPADVVSVGPELAAVAGTVQAEPGAAVARFSAAVSKLSAGWPSIPRDRLIAAHDSILEFLYRAGAGDATARAVEAISRGARAAATAPMAADDVLPAVWSTGMLVRLLGEKDLAATARESVDAAISDALGPARASIEPTFDAGAAAMVHALPHRLIPPGSAANAEVDADAWQRWMQAADAASGGDPAVRNRALIAGLEVLLISGPEPNQSRSTAAVIGQIVQQITWRAGDESRLALLRWFNDRRMTAADLAAVTSALATKSSAEGIELTMVLSTSASDRVRSELRDRYATVWNIEYQAQKDDLTTAWLKAAQAAVDESLSPGGDFDQLERTVVLARLNEAAWLQWRGSGGDASSIVADLRGPIEIAKGPPPPAAKPGLPGAEAAAADGGWAEKYLAARQNAKLRKDLLDQLKPIVGDELGPVDAEVIMGEAIYGTPDSIRVAANDLVRKHATEATMINAALDRLPKLPRTAQISGLIEFLCAKQLPPVRDPSWLIAARRALIERLVEAKAAEGPMARADRLAAVLAVTYRDMASATPLTADQRAEKTQPPVYLSATQVWAAWREAASKMVPVGPPPVRLDEVERRRDGRRSLARGLVQAFAAEQASLAELMAYVIGAEKPGRSDDVRAVVARLSEDRRRAQGIIEQLLSAERAMTQLWIIRLKPEEEPPA
jgi:hypothetical protein